MDRRELMAVSRALDRLPVDQRKAALRALRQVTGKAPLVLRVRAFEAIGDLIRAQARTNARRASDAKTDPARRTLVGARVPREDADRYRAAAAAEGLSLYAWTRAALDTRADHPPPADQAATAQEPSPGTEATEVPAQVLTET